MQIIRLHREKLNEENFDNFIGLLTSSIELTKTRPLDNALINRLKEDAFSRNPKYETNLGRIDLEWVAYVITIMSYSTFMALPSLLIDEIFVLDNFKNLAIGITLLEFCKRKANKSGCGKIELLIPDWNKKSKLFFEFNGAVPVDTTCYQLDPSVKKIRKPRGKLMYLDFYRDKRTVNFPQGRV